MEQDLAQLHAGRSILKPVYQHKDGTFGPPVYVTPRQFTLIEGLLGYHTRGAARLLRRARVPRAAGGAAAPVEGPARLLAARLHDRPGARRARPPRARLGQLHPPAAALGGHRRVVHCRTAAATRSISTRRSSLREGLEHPDLAADRRQRAGHAPDRGRGRAAPLHPRRDRPRGGDEVEEAIWDRMHFASHLRSERLGEFTVGTELHRSHSLAIVQVLILYHLVTARAAVALGGDGTRADRDLGGMPRARDGRALGRGLRGVGGRGRRSPPPGRPRADGRTPSTCPRRRRPTARRS